MTQDIIDGLYLGLALSFLLGPIFIVLIQTSLQHGSKAGLTAASGIWVSDIIIVALTLVFIKKINSYIKDPNFIFWMGIVGGVILIIVGLVTAIKKDNKIQFEKSQKIPATSYFGHWTKGFLVNTINPFTFIFWLTTISSYVATHELDIHSSQHFVIAILFMIVVTDTAKVMLAKLIRPRINEKTLSIINKLAGSALIIFGFVLLLESVL